MKQRKILKLVIILFTVFLLGIFTKEVKASELTGYMGVQEYRESGYGYRIKDRMPPSTGINVWKVVKYPNYTESNPGTIDYTNSIYCVRAGVGFTANSKFVNYTRNYDMKNDKATILNIVSNILSNDGLTAEQIETYKANYNKILWILDNMYVPSSSTSQTDRTTLLTNADISSNLHSTITDDDIEVVQQLVLWYYTNFENTDYHKADFQTIFLGQNDNFQALADYGNAGVIRQAAMEKLFKYFITNAEANSTYESTNISPITINKENASYIEDVTNYKFGPYEITKNSSLPYAFTASFNKSGYVLKDENGNIISNLEQAVNNLAVGSALKLYVYIPQNSGIENLELSYTTSYTTTDATFITTDENTANSEQPLVNIEKTPHEENGKITIIVPKKQYDFSLRKFITKINGQPVDISREPVVDTNPLKNGETTANYNHIKTPLSVKKDDIVTYTIRVYNEGELDGYISEITDHLPEWLDFIPTDEDNIKYGWLIGSNNSTVKTDITSKTTQYTELQNNLYGSRGTTKLSKYTGGDTLDYIDVQINCKVNDRATKGILITNIADITGMTDENGAGIDADRDSIPTNAPELSGDELQNYIGKSTNKPDLTDRSYYYKGQEDDDDFEKLVLNPPELDLKLIKNIVKVNGNDQTERLQSIDVSKLNIATSDKVTTATYNMDKTPILVKKGDRVTYRLRVYNEGIVDGYAKEITEDIPEGLKFVQNDEINNQYGWSNFKYDSNGKIIEISTDYLSREKETVPGDESNLLKAFGENDGTKTASNLSYKEVFVTMEVVSENTLEKVIRNEACISEDSDRDGKDIDDRDSNPKTWVKYEDDEDYDNIVLKPFDLSLRKFITAVSKDESITPYEELKTNGTYDRAPVVDTTKLNTLGTDGSPITTAIYNHTKQPVEVKKGDYVVYTIRVYNEGYQDGYAAEIKDHLPSYLEFVKGSFNSGFGWTVSEDGRTVITDYLSKAYETNTHINKITKPEKIQDGYRLFYQDVQIMCRVKDTAKADEKITNIADITIYHDENGNAILDRDSQIDNVVLPTDENLPSYKDNETGSYIPGQQDDDDFEKVLIKSFDLALRKFITGVNSTPVNNRYPELTYDNDAEKIVYNHTKEPVEVRNGNIVTYTIRIYNEGQTAGYAEAVKDDIPEGLEFLPDNDTNKAYEWKMYKVVETNGQKEYVEVEKAEEADVIITDYLSSDKETAERQNKLNPFNKAAGFSDTNPDYRDVKVAFKVTEPNTSDRILINKAEIQADSDDDIDSTPGEWIEGEDDQDIEKVKVKYFDLALRKWVTEAIVTENGKTNVTQTGHKAEDNPESIVKVELQSKKIDKVTVKFRYKIRVTNEGTIAGYAYELKDYIPAGLKFVQEDNPSWTDLGNNVISTTALENTLLQPGETAEVEVVLTWINGQNNMGLKVNTAEISKDSDDDIDSTPDNKVPGEDDIDDAPVMLSVKTGDIQIYFLLSGIILVTIAGGVILIKKFVL